VVSPVYVVVVGVEVRLDWSMIDGPNPTTRQRNIPLVLLIHGGPQAASTTSFNSLAHLMAARGWVVLSPNYRGSDNRGNAYQRASSTTPARDPAAT